MADTQNTNVQEQDIHQLLKVKREKLANLQQAGKDPFQITKYDVTHHSTDIKNNFEELEGKTVRIAGRVMSKRVMGKASFCNVQDLPGNIQVYVARDNIGEDSYADFKKSDIGDIYGVKGFAFRTKTGEISIHAEEITLLSKSLQILPEKFHGLTDTDTRYRQRYVDLIMNQDSKNVFIKRSQILKEIRNFLAGRDFMEVETPMLVSNAGGAAARRCCDPAPGQRGRGPDTSAGRCCRRYVPRSAARTEFHTDTRPAGTSPAPPDRWAGDHTVGSTYARFPRTQMTDPAPMPACAGSGRLVQGLRW